MPHAADFLDSNVLVYLASADAAKADCAEHRLAEGGTISVQVLNEIANVARRKMGMGWGELDAFLAPLRSLLSVVPMTIETHETGLRQCARHGFSVHDGMIVAAALEAGCAILWSEGMHDGLVIEERMTIRNPFVGG